MSAYPHSFAVTKHDGGVVGTAQLLRRLDDGIKNALKVSGRAANDLEYIRGRGLLLQRFLEFAFLLVCSASNRRVFSMAMTA